MNTIRLLIFVLIAPLFTFAEKTQGTKDVLITCGAGISSFANWSGQIDGRHAIQLTPAPPAPDMSRRAPEMNLTSQNRFQLRKKDNSLVEAHYRITVSQFWPEFEAQTGAWITANKSVTMTLEMFVREISSSGEVKVLGGSTARRALHFGENGLLLAPNDTLISTTLLSPEMYQLAINHPNLTSKNEAFPSSYFDVLKNEYIQSQIASGKLNANEEFESIYTDCNFAY